MKENKKLIYAIFVAIIVVCGIIYVLVIGKDQEVAAIKGPGEQPVEPASEKESQVPETAVEEIYVQLCGAVVREGVYQVKKGTRVFEVVALAGGLTEDAAVETINQARAGQDGEMIYIPTIEAVENGVYPAAGTNATIYLNTATKDELMELPGVGEAKALSIIAYREKNGGFKAIEEIMMVNGIKQSMFDLIKDLITL
ncbi:MAG: helix-hairpin-helix domain-containing protein [Vallitaleaceae bacterium]|nr:helix-hairpin-helix domain-containing protein [Vallitaleaceae bacterium]